MDSGLTRAEKNALTRRKLLDAAREVFVERGFHGASLDAVAERAGFTKGAVYSRFASKADLFLALLEERIDQSLAAIRAMAGSGAVEGDLEATTAFWDEILRTELDWTLLVLEFRVHVARNPDLNRRYAALHRRFRDGIAEAIKAGFAAAGTTPARPAEDLADELLALSSGSALERAADPGVLPVAAMTRLSLDVLRSGRPATT